MNFENISRTSLFGWVSMVIGGLFTAIALVMPEAQTPIDQINQGASQLWSGLNSLQLLLTGFVTNILRSLTLAGGLRGFVGFRK